MKTPILLIMIATLFAACDRKSQVLPCKEITLGESFEAKVHETWCLPDESVKITVSSILEDGRCNVKDVLCVWAGRALVEVQIETSELALYRDTLDATHNWQDTIAIGGYSLELNKIYPLERNDFVVDTSEYAFEFVLKQ